MPSPRQQLKGRRGWNDSHREAIEMQHDYFEAFGPRGSAEADELMRVYWFDFRDELMGKHIEAEPFSRPIWWWKFESTERRQCVNGQHPHDSAIRAAWVAEQEKEHPGSSKYLNRITCGVPSVLGGPDFAANPRPQYETERCYIERRGLLCRYERELIAKGEPCPA